MVVHPFGLSSTRYLNPYQLQFDAPHRKQYPASSGMSYYDFFGEQDSEH
jgi:hypothetical protein